MSSLRGWRPHTEKPTKIPVTAIIAVPDEEESGEFFLLTSVHQYTKSVKEWRDEVTDKPVSEPVFWWKPESEVLADIAP